MGMVSVLVFGTFDVIHPGHVHFLKESKKFGDELLVVVARDETVKNLKGKEPLHAENERLKQVSSLDFVDKAILGNKDDKFKVVEILKPDIICLGYDQESFTHNLQEELLKRNVVSKIIRFDKGHLPHIYKSSKIKKSLGL